MGNDLIRQAHDTGYCRQMKRPFSVALFGLLVFIAAFPLEFWNEGRVVARQQALLEGVGEVRSVPATPIDPANAGKLIHLSGKMTAAPPPVDAELGVSAPGIALLRKVEMFQWQEAKESHEETQADGGGKTVTTWRYESDWSEKLHASRQFHEPAGHGNPERMPFASTRYDAGTVLLGDYSLGSAVIDKLDGAVALPAKLDKLPANLAASFQVHGDALVTGESPDRPKIGDIRIRYSTIPEQVISVIGIQGDAGVGSYATKTGPQILLVEKGEHSAEDMFSHAESHNTELTWALRGTGFGMMWFGLAAAFGWFGRLFDIVPWIGSLVETGVGIVTALLAAACSLMTIAIAWFAHRPLLSLAIIATAVLSLFAIKLLKTNVRTETASLASPPTPPLSQG